MSSAPARTWIGAGARRITCVLKAAAFGAGLGAAGGALFGVLWGLLFGLAHGMWWESLAAAVGLPVLCGAYFGAGGALAGLLTGGCYGISDAGAAADTRQHSKDWAPRDAGAERTLPTGPDAGPEGMSGDGATRDDEYLDRLALRTEVPNGR